MGGELARGEGAVALGAEPRLAVAEALELLHEDYAYEFQIGWSLWELESASGDRWSFDCASCKKRNLLRSG